MSKEKEHSQKAIEDLLKRFTQSFFDNSLSAFIENFYDNFKNKYKKSPEALQQIEDLKKLLEPMRTAATAPQPLHDVLQQIDCIEAAAIDNLQKFKLIEDITIALITIEKTISLIEIKTKLIRYLPQNPTTAADNAAAPRFLSEDQAIIINEIIENKGTAAKGSPNYKIIKEIIKNYNSARAANPFYFLPTSPASNLIYDILAAGEKNINSLSARKKTINHSTDITVQQNKSARRIEQNKQEEQIIIEIPNINAISKNAKKIFIFTLMKANEQALHDGILTQDYITFPLKELINIKLYNSPQSARKGFTQARNVLTSLKAQGVIKKGKKDASIDSLEVLFTGGRIEKGQCTIYLNDRINWNFITWYFSFLPVYYFQLPNRASDLLYYIFYLARQNTKEIETREYFTISFRSIQAKLNLPSEIENREPQKTIKQPIEEAIEEIENAHSNYYNNMDLSLMPIYDDTAPIKEFLDNGYLKVTLNGEFAKPFTKISQKQSKQIETALKRKNAIIDRAKAIAIANKEEQRKDK